MSSLAGKIKATALVGSLLSLAASNAVALEPLYVKNLSPVAGLFGLPSQRSAQTVNRGESSLALHASIASHYVVDGDDDEAINLDGETQRLALEWRYGLADNWEVQLEVPWLDHSGGHLDSLIDDWHELWGFSDGGRSQGPSDVLDYHYRSSADTFDLQDDASGVGDVSLSLSRQIYQDADAAASVALGYKFASGEEEDFLGSGEDDWFVTLRFSGAHLADWPLYWHGQLGYMRAGDVDILAQGQENNLWFAGLSGDWQFNERWSLLLQVDVHAAPADSALAALGDEAVMLTVGGRWRFHRNWALELSVVEDAQVETAPDVTFQGSVRYYSGR